MCQSGKGYSHRKQWVIDRREQLNLDVGEDDHVKGMSATDEPERSAELPAQKFQAATRTRAR